MPGISGGFLSKTRKDENVVKIPYNPLKNGKKRFIIEAEENKEDLFMIKLIYGPKGFGKTKIIMDDINAAAKTAKGNVVFITDKKICSVDIDLNVRCLYTEEYGVNTVESFLGFVKGLIAGNSDIEYLFIDGILRITHSDLPSLETFCAELEKLHEETGLKVEMTVSSAKENLPAYMLEYLK